MTSYFSYYEKANTFNSITIYPNIITFSIITVNPDYFKRPLATNYCQGSFFNFMNVL